MKRTADQFRQDPESYVAAVTKTCERRTELLADMQRQIAFTRIRIEAELAHLEQVVRDALREIEQ